MALRFSAASSLVIKPASSSFLSLDSLDFMSVPFPPFVGIFSGLTVLLGEGLLEMTFAGAL